MKKTIYILFLTLAFNVNAQSKNENCFKNVKLESGFVAFSSSQKSNIANWYQKVFDLEIVKEFTFPDGTITGKLMKKDEFAIEVFNRKKIFKRKDYKPISKSEEWKGIMKFGIYTNANLPSLKKCLKNNNINAGRIFKDINLGINLLLIRDPEGNLIEIISRIKE